ncbi:MAG: phosphoribosyltransferase family protein [Campylobacterota bacterium]|nr:phosphoribosyltransferase family protein [Campylobacterota bacterium]
MINYAYEAFEKDTKCLIEQVKPYQPDLIVAIARGGMMLGQVMGYGLGVRNVQTIHVESYDGDCQRDSVSVYGSCDLSNAKRVLIVDDIVDSGETLQAVLETLQRSSPDVQIKTAALFYKSTASVSPDFKVREATEWIGFFWEKEYE